MKCPNCGNELSPDEAFCGQCGTPTMPPAHPTEMVNTPSPRSGFLNPNNPNLRGARPATGAYNGRSGQSNVLPPTASYGQGLPSSSPTGSLMPGQLPPPSSPWPSAPQQPGSFYQDATEAMPMVPPGQSYPGGYGQQNFAGTPMQGSYAGAPGTEQFGAQTQQVPPAQPAQPFRPGPYASAGGPSYPQAPGFSSAQGYGGASKITPPPRKQTNIALVIACVLLVVALLAAIGFATLYLTRGRSPNTANTPTVTATAAPSPTAIPSPTPTTAPTPTPTTAPSPTVAPTPTPDPGFAWCSTTCTTNGFLVEYPGSWTQGQTADATGTQFTNPAQADEYAAFKTPGATSSSAGDLVNQDLQSNFATKTGYTLITPSATTTIDGENWTYAVATYQNAALNNTVEQVAVYATVHQGKAYLIELQAPQTLYTTVNTQYFDLMLKQFQFQQVTTTP